MRISSVNRDKLSDLSIEQKNDIIFDNIADNGECGDVALLLGCPFVIAKERAECAAKLWHDGRVKYIISSGGASRKLGDDSITEAEFMANCLKDAGVPEEAILLENTSRSTIENMICSNLTINRALGIYNIKRALIVTSEWHLRRSIELAKALLARNIEVSGVPAPSSDCSRDMWHKSDAMISRINNEIRLLIKFASAGMIEDIEFNEKI